jgi:hypothetical protein
VVCTLCAVVTFGFAPGQRRPAAFCVITRDKRLEVRGICGGCLNKDEWLAGRVTDLLAREGRAARATELEGRQEGSSKKEDWWSCQSLMYRAMG